MRSCEIDAGVERLVSQTPFKPDQTRSSTSHERQPRRRCQERRYHLIYLFDCRRRSFHYRMSCLAVVAAGLQCLGTSEVVSIPRFGSVELLYDAILSYRSDPTKYIPD